MSHRPNTVKRSKSPSSIASPAKSPKSTNKPSPSKSKTPPASSPSNKSPLKSHKSNSRKPNSPPASSPSTHPSPSPSPSPSPALQTDLQLYAVFNKSNAYVIPSNQSVVGGFIEKHIVCDTGCCSHLQTITAGQLQEMVVQFPIRSHTWHIAMSNDTRSLKTPTLQIRKTNCI